MDVYSVGGDLNQLYLLDHDYVVNGDWYLEKNKKGQWIHPFTNLPLDLRHEMKAPCGGHYNVVLEEAREILLARREAGEVPIPCDSVLVLREILRKHLQDTTDKE